MIRIGCSGWSYEHWRGTFYPRSGSSNRWLETYAESFDTVEINATFYRLPSKTTVAGWAAKTPEDFLFAVKASRYLTHVRRLRGLGDGLRRLEGRISPLRSAAKLGPILWQLPRQFHRDDERLASALTRLPEGRHAFEFRHESWFADDIYELLRSHRAALVVADRAPAGSTPWEATTDWSYIRFHAGRGRNGVYTPRQLQEWADRIAELDGDVYAYFNNDWEGFAIENATRLRSLLDGDPSALELRGFEEPAPGTGSMQTRKENQVNEITNPRDLFLHELGDILYVERKLSGEVLPKLIAEVRDDEFKSGLEKHLEQTKQHVTNVEKVFRIFEEQPHEEPCIGFEGLKREHDELLKQSSPSLVDSIDLGAAARTENYEIAAYEGLRRMAKGLGEDDAVSLLDENLAQEKDALRAVEKISTRVSNEAFAGAGAR